MSRFHRKTVLVTGGTTGIGLAAARAFAEEGARVVVTGTHDASIAAARGVLPASAEVVSSDAGSAYDIEQLAHDLVARNIRLDAMFLNAGIVRFGSIAELDPATLDESLRLNLVGPWLALKHLAALIVDGGAVVVTTAVNANIGAPGSSAYAASKAGLRALVRVAAAELAPRGIRVNAVCPGPIDTPLYDKLRFDDAGRRALIAKVPLGRFGTADEVARAVLFFASSDAGFATGAELVLDGGMTTI